MTELYWTEIYAQRASLETSKPFYSCLLKTLPYLKCLDVGSISTLANSIPSLDWTIGDLTPAAELDIIHNETQLFGQVGQCARDSSSTGGLFTVSDYLINVNDLSVYISYIFQDAPYHTISRNPATIETGIDLDLLIADQMCSNYTSAQDQLDDYTQCTCYCQLTGCTQCGRTDGTDPLYPYIPFDRRKMLQMQDEQQLSIVEVKYSDSKLLDFRRKYSYNFLNITNNIQSIPRFLNRFGQLPEQQVLRSFRNNSYNKYYNVPQLLNPLPGQPDFVKASLHDDGSWLTLHMDYIALRFEATLSNLQISESGILSNLEFLENEKPFDPSKIEVRFTRFCENMGRDSLKLCQQYCANIVSGKQNRLVHGNSFNLLQIPAAKSCGFDVHIWIPKSDIMIDRDPMKTCFSYIWIANGNEGTYGKNMCPTIYSDYRTDRPSLPPATSPSQPSISPSPILISNPSPLVSYSPPPISPISGQQIDSPSPPLPQQPLKKENFETNILIEPASLEDQSVKNVFYSLEKLSPHTTDISITVRDLLTFEISDAIATNDLTSFVKRSLSNCYDSKCKVHEDKTLGSRRRLSLKSFYISKTYTKETTNIQDRFSTTQINTRTLTTLLKVPSESVSDVSIKSLPIKVTINTSQESKQDMQISEVSKVLGVDESAIEVNSSEEMSPSPPSPSTSEDNMMIMWIVITSITAALILVICVSIYYIRKLRRNKSPPISDSHFSTSTNSNVILKKQTHIKSRGESPRMSSRPSHFEGTSKSLNEKNKKKYAPAEDLII